MKYSLRSLMIVVTLVCVVLGGVMGRVEYLRRWAAFHRRQEGIWLAKVRELRLSGQQDELDAATNRYVRHNMNKVEYLNATYRPWTRVDELPIEEAP